VGYEALTEFIQSWGLLSVPGDIVEIGAFCGGGTYKLAKFLQQQKSPKRVYTIDCFDIQVDQTENTDGMRMAQLYEASLKGNSQRQVFDKVTAGIRNLFVIVGDSKAVVLPAEAVCFGFIDGNHADDYVVNDFYLVGKKLSPGGVIAFHDYGYDLPGVTAAIDQLCARHSAEIARVHVDLYRHVIYLRKAMRKLIARSPKS
jgi:predicted O-methyltransferase YrrM